MIQLHRKGWGAGSGYWVGDSFLLDLERRPDGKWKVNTLTLDPRCREWLERNPDVSGMTFARLSEARAYLDAVCELDPLPDHQGGCRHRLRRLCCGCYQVTHPEFEPSNVTLRRKPDKRWQVYLSDEEGVHEVQLGGTYQSLWHAQANLDEVFEMEYLHAATHLERMMAREAAQRV